MYFDKRGNIMKKYVGADSLKEVYSGIRGPLYEEALRMKAEGKEVLRLNTGNPGAFGFEMPESIKEVFRKKMCDTVSYCDFKGVKESREVILKYHNENGIKHIDEDDIYITNGVSEAATMLTKAILNRDDEILLPSPCYSLWSNCVLMTGAKPVFYKCNDKTWNPDVEDIRSKITDKTVAVLIINPNNPTGAVYEKNILKQIADIAYENELILISDEIYDRLVYEGTDMVSTASLANDDTLCITLNGLSKSHNICGLRCGWMVLSGNKNKKNVIKKDIDKLASMRLCANSLTNFIIPAAISDSETPKRMVSPGGMLYERRKAVFKELDKCENLSYVKNQGAFYIFPKINNAIISDDKKMCLDLLHSKNILVMPGSCFDYGELNRIRIVMLPDAETMTKAIIDMEDFFREYTN